MLIYKTDKNLLIQNECIYQLEKLWIPYFHDLFLIGRYDYITENKEANTKLVTFMVNDEDRKHFPELKDTEKVKIYLVDNRVEQIY